MADEGGGIGSLEYCPNEKEVEKFANLIILQCAILASRHENDDNIDSVYSVITQHFGVKL